MARKTRKAGAAGSLGPRYGVKIRNRYKTVIRKQKTIYNCPRCSYQSVRRVSSGIWYCRHCELKFAGGAFVPVTRSDQIEAKWRIQEERRVREADEETAWRERLEEDRIAEARAAREAEEMAERDRESLEEE